MTDQDRREFLEKLAKTAVYAAPVVYSLAAPTELIGLVKGDKSGGMVMMAAPATTEPTSSDAPWDKPPPGQRP